MTKPFVEALNAMKAAETPSDAKQLAMEFLSSTGAEGIKRGDAGTFLKESTEVFKNLGAFEENKAVLQAIVSAGTNASYDLQELAGPELERVKHLQKQENWGYANKVVLSGVHEALADRPLK